MSATDTTVTVTLQGKDQLSPATDAAAQSADKAAESVQQATQATEEMAQASRAARPELQSIAAEMAAQRQAAEEQAKALGVSVGELRQLEAQLQKTGAARQAETAGADEWARSLSKGADAADEFGESAGKVGQTAAKAAGALGLVSPEAGAAAQGLVALADAGEVAATVSGVLGVSLGVLATAAGVVLAILAPLAIGFTVMSREEDEADARTAFLTDHMHDLDSAARGLEDAVLAAAVATGKLSDEQAKLQAIQDKANRSVEDFRKSQEDERRTAEEAYFLAQKRKDQFSVLGETIGGAVDWMMGWSSAQEEATWTLQQLDDQEQQHQDIVVETAKAETEGAKATIVKTDATKAATAATKEAAKEERELAKAKADVAKAEASRTQAINQLAAITATALSAEEKARAAYRAREEVIRAAIDADADFADIVAAKSASLQQLVKDLDAARDAQDALNQSTIDGTAISADAKAGSTANAISGGPEAGVNALADSSGFGALIASLVELFTNFGDSVAAFQDYHNQILDTIATFPQILADNLDSILSDSLITAVPDFVSSLAENLPKIMEGLFSRIPEVAAGFVQALIIDMPKAAVALVLKMSDPNTWIDVVRSFVQALVDAVRGLFKANAPDRGEDGMRRKRSDQPGSAVGDWFKKTGNNIADLFTGSYATGSDYVAETGMALVHQGERIINADGTMSQRTAVITGGESRTVVQVNFPPGLLLGSVETVTRALNTALGASGQTLALGS